MSDFEMIMEELPFLTSTGLLKSLLEIHKTFFKMPGRLGLQPVTWFRQEVFIDHREDLCSQAKLELVGAALFIPKVQKLLLIRG
jgi:hypothetical protein